MTRAEFVQRLTKAVEREPSYHSPCILDEHQERVLALADCDARLAALGKLLPRCSTHAGKRDLVRRIDVWLDQRLHLLGR